MCICIQHIILFVYVGVCGLSTVMVNDVFFLKYSLVMISIATSQCKKHEMSAMNDVRIAIIVSYLHHL